MKKTGELAKNDPVNYLQGIIMQKQLWSSADWNHHPQAAIGLCSFVTWYWYEDMKDAELEQCGIFFHSFRDIQG